MWYWGIGPPSHCFLGIVSPRGSLSAVCWSSNRFTGHARDRHVQFSNSREVVFSCSVSSIRRRSDYIIGFVTPAIGPNKFKKLTRLIALVHNIRGKVWMKNNIHGFTDNKLIVCEAMCMYCLPFELQGSIDCKRAELDKTGGKSTDNLAADSTGYDASYIQLVL